MTITLCIAAYLIMGIAVRRMTYAGPEDDGWLWCILLWPLVVIGIAIDMRR